MELRDRLPTFPVPPAAARHAAQPTLEIRGLVARPQSLTPADLTGLARATHDEPFTCEEGWAVPGLRWGGVRLADVLALAEPLPAARFVRVGSGDYVIPVRLDEASAGLLCDTLNGAPLTVEHGAPWRLLLAGGACFSSVKWVTRLEVSAEAGEASGERIARARVEERASGA
jgi:DMSO/TMAO reductase YedYZ molybdopterin-dependent catalytic subunit